MKIFLAELIGFLLIVGACSQGYMVNLEEKSHHTEGRDLYISKCNSCHKLYDPNNFTEAGWDSIMIPMTEKAKLKPEQKDEIFSWIIEVKNNKKSILNK
jgi:hypothetical protein